MSTVDSRNAAAKTYVETMLAEAGNFQPSSSFLSTYAKANTICDALIETRANGFRGVVLTVIVGMYLDNNFNPTTNFYDCNPRSIFEKAIYYALKTNDVPCGKSDPLNVAKNAQQLDVAWAKGKRPETASMAVVEYVKLLWSSKGKKEHGDLVKLFFYRLYQYGVYVKSQNVSIQFSSTAYNGAVVAKRLGNFVVECAEGGALTQFVVGLLINEYRKNNAKFQAVKGFDESVFGTNTTSKKPADVWEVMADGQLGKLYEITVKIIDEKRLDDCVDALIQQELVDSEVIFVCNLPSNVSSLDVVDNCIDHKGFSFQFVDIKGFVNSLFITLGKEQQEQYIKTLQDFVFSSARAVTTKQYWASNFSNL